MKKKIYSDPFLGEMPDRIIAEKYGTSITMVFLVRRKKGIKAFHRHWNNNHRRKIDMVAVMPFLGKQSDADIGREYNVTRERIRQIRKLFGVSKYQEVRE